MEFADFGLEPGQIATDHHSVNEFEIVDAAARVRMVGMLKANGVDAAGPEVGVAGIADRLSNGLLDVKRLSAGPEFIQRIGPAPACRVVAPQLLGVGFTDYGGAPDIAGVVSEFGRGVEGHHVARPSAPNLSSGSRDPADKA